jgi:putative ATPase
MMKPGAKRPPLAERMRPQSLEEFVGQEDLVGPDKPLRRMIEQNEIRSLVLWGPPGTGKTTLGWIIARSCGADFLAFSATRSSIKEIQGAMERSKRKFLSYKTRDVIFVDELHQLQQSAASRLSALRRGRLDYLNRGLLLKIRRLRSLRRCCRARRSSCCSPSARGT